MTPSEQSNIPYIPDGLPKLLAHADLIIAHAYHHVPGAADAIDAAIADLPEQAAQAIRDAIDAYESMHHPT